MEMPGHRTAAVLVIGNEVLSGRTREANAWLAAQRLFARGCRLREIAVVPDERDAIVSAVNRLRAACDAVVTSGGIGPTHDDITMQSVADAFGVPLADHAATLAAMVRHYGAAHLNDGRRRMARLPSGATTILCEKSIAPGARIGNVYVLAGVPEIFASQLETILPDFGGRPFLRRQLDVDLPESSFAAALDEIQKRFPGVEIGSYPQRCGSRPQGKICLSSQDAGQLEAAETAVTEMLKAMHTA